MSVRSSSWVTCRHRATRPTKNDSMTSQFSTRVTCKWGDCCQWQVAPRHVRRGRPAHCCSCSCSCRHIRCVSWSQLNHEKEDWEVQGERNSECLQGESEVFHETPCGARRQVSPQSPSPMLDRQQLSPPKMHLLAECLCCACSCGVRAQRSNTHTLARGAHTAAMCHGAHTFSTPPTEAQ